MMILNLKTAAIVALAAMTVAGGAIAHPKVLRLSPAADKVVAAPTRIELVFSERLIPAMTAADVMTAAAPGHAAVKLSGIRSTLGADGKTLIVTPQKPLMAGRYQVNWHAVSIDTHRVQGSYRFAVR